MAAEARTSSRDGHGHGGHGRRRPRPAASLGSGTTGDGSGTTDGSGRRRRRPPSPVLSAASATLGTGRSSVDPDGDTRYSAAGGVDPEGSAACSSAGGDSSSRRRGDPRGSIGGPSPRDGNSGGDEGAFAASARARRLASIERRGASSNRREEVQARRETRKGDLVAADASSGREGRGGSRSGAPGSGRGGTNGDLSAEARRYAARARKKASLLTHHDFGESRASKSASQSTRSSRSAGRSGKSTKEGSGKSSTTGEPSWISGQMSISNQSATSKAPRSKSTREEGTLEGTLEDTTYISGAHSLSKGSYPLRRGTACSEGTRSYDDDHRHHDRNYGDDDYDYQDEEEEDDEDEEYDEYEVYEEWTESTSTLPDFTDRTIGGLSSRTSVSSMTSVDSYVREQRYLHRLKLEELQARRELRAAQRRRAREGGECFDEGTCDEEGTVFLGEDESGLGSFASGTHDKTRDTRSSGRSSDRSSHGRSSDRSSDRSSGRSSGRSSDRSSRGWSSRSSKTHDRTKSTRSTRESSFHQSHRDRSRRARPARDSSPAPVYQREECCIKHPAVLLRPQTDIEVWTCMRYLKDPESGRWHTAKMVCPACLDEAAEDSRYGYKQRRRDDPRGLGRQRGRRHLYDDEESATEESYCSSDESTDEDMTRSSSSQDPSSANGSGGSGVWHDATVGVRPLADQTPLEREAEAQRRRFVRRLAARAYHFPGNTWGEDWLQYTRNTHLVFGIFLHHPLHPVTSRERCVILLGSVAVGMMMSNIIYLWFVRYEFGKDDVVMNVWGFNITKLMATLWTVGSVAHTLFDLGVWHIKACTACRYLGGGDVHVSDGAVRCGRRAGVTIVLVTLAFSSYLVLLRASEDYEASLAAAAEAGDGTIDAAGGDDEEGGESFLSSVTLGGGAEHFDFLVGYIVEFVLAVFVYNPLILTVVFTGVLGCNGRIPILGGRPREVAREERYARKRQRYTMPRVLKLGDREYVADGWGDGGRPATNF